MVELELFNDGTSQQIILKLRIDLLVNLPDTSSVPLDT
jgi:hypothetical protein